MSSSYCVTGNVFPSMTCTISRFGDDGCPRTLQAFLDSIGPNLYFRYRWEREREAVSSGTLSEYLNIPTSLPNTRHKSLINYVLCRSSNNPHHTAIEKIIFIVLPLSEFYLIFSVKAAKFPINHWRMTATEGWWAMLQRWRTFSFPENKHFSRTNLAILRHQPNPGFLFTVLIFMLFSVWDGERQIRAARWGHEPPTGRGKIQPRPPL